MYIPSQKQWQTVIDKLYSVLPFTLDHPRRSMNMQEPCVNTEHPCGTVHCLGGWYAIAHWKESAFDRTKILDYKDGAHQMAHDLGFSDRLDLYNWASLNEELWGNKKGYELFHYQAAFTPGKKKSATSLEDIIHHFENVKERCHAYSNKKSMAKSNR